MWIYVRNNKTLKNKFQIKRKGNSDVIAINGFYNKQNNHDHHWQVMANASYVHSFIQSAFAIYFILV